MDFLSTKALTIAVGISISLTITSAILFTLSQITSLYQDVYKTDVSIKKQFTEFAMYDGTTMTGLQMYNAGKKFLNDVRVTVTCNIFGTINTSSWVNSYNGNDANYTSRLYDVTYSVNNADGKVTINFRGR